MAAPRLLHPAHLMLHRRPASVSEGCSITIAGYELATVTVTPQQQSEPFSISFEVAVERLAELSQMFVEPDGSFVWVAASGAELGWQLDGVVNDRANRVVSVEVKGTCPRPQFETLLRVFDWPEVGLLVQLVQAAAFLDDAEYFRFAERSAVG